MDMQLGFRQFFSSLLRKVYKQSVDVLKRLIKPLIQLAILFDLISSFRNPNNRVSRKGIAYVN